MCLEYVNDVSADWEWYVDHIGRLVDFKNAYKTLAISFVSGFLMAVGVAIRDELGGKDKSSAVHKLPV